MGSWNILRESHTSVSYLDCESSTALGVSVRMQTTEADGYDTDEQESDDKESAEWLWEDRVTGFLETVDDLAETCLNQVVGSTVVDHVHVDNLADIDDISDFHETLSPDQFIDGSGEYDLDWETEIDDGEIAEVYLTCHAEHVDTDREVSTEVDVAIVIGADDPAPETVTEPHIIHRPTST